MKNQDLILIIAILVFVSCREPVIIEPPCGTDVYLEYPTNGTQTYDIKPYFQWNLNDYCGEEFRFQMSDYEFFTNYIEDTSVIGNSYTSPHVYTPNRTYYWRIMNFEDSIYLQDKFVTADFFQQLAGFYQGTATYKTTHGTDSVIQNAAFELPLNEFGGAFMKDSVIIIYDTYDAEKLYFNAFDFNVEPLNHRMSYDLFTRQIDFCTYENSSNDCLFHYTGNK